MTLYDEATGVAGYGFDEEEARRELNLNKARKNINSDPFYLKRRHMFYSWLPTDQSLSIAGVTTITYDGTYLQDSVKGYYTLCSKERFAHYYDLYYLLATYISFEDFTITIGPEVDQFLNNISPNYGSLKDFPNIEMSKLEQITALHKLSIDGVVGETNNGFIAISGIQSCFVPRIGNIKDKYLVSYALARLGITYNGKDAYWGAKL